MACWSALRTRSGAVYLHGKVSIIDRRVKKTRSSLQDSLNAMNLFG